MISRRNLISSVAMLTTGLVFAGASFGMTTVAAGFQNYEEGMIQQALENGETVFVDFAADWCTTCRAQEREIFSLQDANPEYRQKITFIRVDWDDFSSAPITKDLKIPRRSTLVLLRGDKELGRIVAGTKRADIKALIEKGL